MAIHTDRPGGGDDAMVVHRAKSADEARKVRAALEGVGVPVDLPDQAIDAWFAAKTEELQVKVAIKHWSKAVRAIENVIPREEPEEPKIHEAENRQEAAAAKLQAAPEPAAADTDKVPASAIDKSALRAFYVSCASIFAPPVGLAGAVWGMSVWSEMSSRPDDFFRRKLYAQIATFLGLLTGIVGTLVAVLKFARHH